jgi:hypothetical protein
VNNSPKNKEITRQKWLSISWNKRDFLQNKTWVWYQKYNSSRGYIYMNHWLKNILKCKKNYWKKNMLVHVDILCCHTSLTVLFRGHFFLVFLHMPHKMLLFPKNSFGNIEYPDVHANCCSWIWTFYFYVFIIRSYTPRIQNPLTITVVV